MFKLSDLGVTVLALLFVAFLALLYFVPVGGG
jgi:hypothetical protein